MNVKKNVVIICVMLMMISFLPVNASNHQDDEIVRWDNPAEDVIIEPYTLPFFEVYELKDYGQTVYGLASSDLNNDGWLDFAVGWTTSPNNHSGISIFYREDDRSFRIEDIIQYPWGITDLEAVDFNDDEYVDLFCVRYEGDGVYSVDIIWNDDGVFNRKSAVVEFREDDGYWINVHIATADFDRDGDVDFIAGANCGKVKLFKNDGTNRFSDEGEIFDYGDVSWGLDIGDFNDDDYPDFLVSARSNSDSDTFDEGHIYLKLNDQTSTCFDNSPGVLIKSINRNVDIIGACEHGSISIIDYDGDGDLDFLAGYYNPFLYNNRDGMFDRFPLCNLQETKDGWDSLRQGGFTTGDFNYDGKIDFVAGGVQGVVRLFINNYQQFPPIKPQIIGPENVLDFRTGFDYNFTFVASDINEDEVYIFVDWGDGTDSGWIGTFESGERILLNHTWMNRSLYSLRVKAKDIHGLESDWTTMKVRVHKKQFSSLNEWNLISIKGKCEGWSTGTILHFFNLWATHQPMSLFDVSEDTKIRINGELYPLDKTSDVRMKGFVGTSFFPFRWILYEKQEIEPPYDIVVFGFCKQVDIV